MVAAVAADGAIAIVKFLGGAFTGSAVMMAEGAHSIVDGANTSLMLLGQKRAARPPTELHPFGYGNEVYFWSAVVAMVAFVVGGGFAVVEGVLGWHESARGPLWPNLVILGAAGLFNGASLWIALRELERYKRDKGYRGGIFATVEQSHNPPVFLSVLLDLAAMIGIGVALIGVVVTHLTGSSIPDAIAAIVDGLVMMATAVVLAIESRSLIIGEGARHALIDDARRAVERHHAVSAVDDLRTLQLGPENVIMVLRARFREELRGGELARIGRELEASLKRRHPSIKHVVFDFD